MCSLRSTAPSREGVNRKRFNITAHYQKSASRCAELRFVADRWRALRVRVMVGYVLRPNPATALFCSRCSVGLVRRFAQGGVDPRPPCGRPTAARTALLVPASAATLPVRPGGAPMEGEVQKSRRWRYGSHRRSNDLLNGIHENKTPREGRIC